LEVLDDLTALGHWHITVDDLALDAVLSQVLIDNVYGVGKRHEHKYFV
jgi:hypothetical protein